MTLTAEPTVYASGTELLAATRVLAELGGSAPHRREGVARRWERLATTGPYEAWLIVWPQGSAIELHDHGASGGAMAMVSGVLEEIYLSWEHGDAMALRSRNLFAGRSVLLPPDHVHGLTNGSDVPAISVHI